MKPKFLYLFLFIILIIATYFRLYKIGQVPSGFYIDEAAIGYNAYSILKTGKDEFGKNFPVLFRSFTDFKAPIYEYLLVPIFSVFDMSPITTRIPAVIAGIISILILYLLTFKLTYSKFLGLTSAFLLAFSPWHILFSRTTYEISLALMFLLLSLLFFFKSQNNSRYFILTALFASLAILTYHAQRIITPLLYIALIIINRHWIFHKNNKYPIILSVILGSILILPLLSLINTPGFNSRLDALNIFSTTRTSWDYNPSLTGWQSYIFNFRPLLLFKEWLSLYFAYFSPRYLFGIGDPGGLSSLVNTPPLFLWQLPLWLLGIYSFVNQRLYRNKLGYLLILLLIITPIPASITGDPFSSIRALPMIIPHIILIALGLNLIYRKVHSAQLTLYLKISLYVTFLILISYSLIRLHFSIFIFMNSIRHNYWNHGAQNLFTQLSNYNLPVVIDNSRDELYILALFFTKFDPATYQNQNFEVPLNEYYTNMQRNRQKTIGNMEVRPINWNYDARKNQIIVADSLMFDPSDSQIKEHCLTKLFEIKSPENKTIYTAVHTNPDLKNTQGSCY